VTGDRVDALSLIVLRDKAEMRGRERQDCRPGDRGGLPRGAPQPGEAMSDPIVAEVRTYRQAIAAECGGDPVRIAAHAQATVHSNPDLRRRAFWSAIRIAVGSILPEPVVVVGADARGYPPSWQLDLWLTPDVVEHFEEGDYAGMFSESDCRQLRQAVEAFRAVAARVPGDQPTTKEQVNAAGPHLQKLADILRVDRYADPDAYAIGSRVDRALATDPSAARVHVQYRSLWLDRPGLMAEIAVDDSAGAPQPSDDDLARIGELIKQAIARFAPEVVPHVRVLRRSRVNPAPAAG
jgi:hypothetical protein